MESQRPDALIKDERARSGPPVDQETLQKTLALTEDFGRARCDPERSRFDRASPRIPETPPGCGVVHIGCGLDTRLKRVDNGRVECMT